MDWLQIVSVLDAFEADILAVGAIVYVATFLLKKTLLKKLPKKYLTAVPFILGMLLYAAFTALFRFSIRELWAEPQETIQNGLASGSAATVIHVIYEQFIRKGVALSQKSLTAEYAHEILTGFMETVPHELAEQVANLDPESGTIEVELQTLLPSLSKKERDILALLLKQVPKKT